ncbi:MAG: EamA family transporter [Lachnospiraceae bacterium]|nr:EamA family transporter [Lachnospiraceae bacterium]
MSNNNPKSQYLAGARTGIPEILGFVPNTKSLIMLLLSMIIYGSIGIFRRYIPLSSAILACFRGASGALLLFIVAKVQKKKIANHIGIKKVSWLALTGAVMGFNWILLFEAYNYTTVATATLCYYMQPTIVILLSPLIFKEKMTVKKRLCVLISVIGMVFVSGLIENGIPALADAKGILLALGAAVLYASVVIMNKKLPGIDSYEKTIIQLLSAAVVLIPYLLLTNQTIDTAITPIMVIMLLIVGFVHTGVAYALYFGSMDGLKAQTVAIFSYLDPITAMILSSVILREKMSAWGIVGALLIIGAALGSEITLKKKLHRKG